jgi:hypothetical protein
MSTGKKTTLERIKLHNTPQSLCVDLCETFSPK